MSFFIWPYLIGFILFATRLGYVMRTGLDEFDWMYHRNDIWLRYAMTLIFWPIVLLFKPGLLLTGERLFVYDMVLGSTHFPDIAQRTRSLKQFSDSPSLCGNTLYYDHEGVGESDKMTRQWFEADNLITLYKGKTLPLYSDFESTALISWITKRDKTIELPTEVPELINFQNVAVSLLDAGYGHVECNVCAIRYRASELSRQVPPLHVGWNKATYQCPKGHSLLRYKHVHVSM